MAALAAGPSVAMAPDTPQPTVKMRTFDPADFTHQAEDLPAGLVEAVQGDLDMAAEEYLAGAAAARLATDVVADLGDAVSSSWLDGQVLHVVVGTKADASTAQAAGATAHVGDALTDALAAARAQDKVAYIDRAADRVVPVDTALAGEPVEQLRLTAQADWRGGNGFAISDLLLNYRCSTGFNGTDDDGTAHVLTAGHCGSGDDGLLSSPVRHLDVPAPIGGEGDLVDTWPKHIGDEVGEYATDSFAFGDGRDAGLIEVTNDGWRALPEVASVAGDAGLQVYDSIDAIAGAPVCSSGATSGWTCGQILDSLATVPVSGADVTGFIFDACVLPGDSGGPIMVGNYALGINSGSASIEPICAPNPAADDVSLGYAVSSGEDNVEALYGGQWELLIDVGRPVVTSPGDSSTVGRRPTFAGTVAAAAGATVAVSIDDGPAIEAKVGPAGRWKTAASQILEPGSHTYAVTTSHTSVTGSTRVSSSTTTGSFEVAEVATLSVTAPEPNDTIGAGRPTFEGTGQPDATVTLTVAEEERGSTTVDSDGGWSLQPDEGLPAGRVDAVLTQEMDESSDSVTVAAVGVTPESPVVTNPRPGDQVGSDHTITGVGIVGATVSVTVSGADGGLSASDTATVQTQTDAEGVWEVELDAPLAAGVQAVTATQAVDDLTSEPSRPVSFEVGPAQARNGDHAGDDDDLAESGPSINGLLLAGALLLALGTVVAAVTVRRRLS